MTSRAKNRLARRALIACVCAFAILVISLGSGSECLRRQIRALPILSCGYRRTTVQQHRTSTVHLAITRRTSGLVHRTISSASSNRLPIKQLGPSRNCPAMLLVHPPCSQAVTVPVSNARRDSDRARQRIGDSYRQHRRHSGSILQCLSRSRAYARASPCFARRLQIPLHASSAMPAVSPPGGRNAFHGQAECFA